MIQRSRTLGMLCGILLCTHAACGGSDGTALGEAPALSGHIVDQRTASWSLGAGYTLVVRPSGSTTALTSTQIEADGRFTLQLPSGSSIGGSLHPVEFGEPPSGCTGSYEPDAAMTHSMTAVFEVYQGTMRRDAVALRAPGTVDGQPVTQTLRVSYYDRDSSLVAELDCPGQRTAHYSISFQFKKGWNVSSFTERSVSGGPAQSYQKTVPLPPDVSWVIGL